MKSPIHKLSEGILKSGEHSRFRNERRKFPDLIEILSRFPDAISPEGVFVEPYRSLVFLATIGQRPATSLLILEIFLNNEEPLNGRAIGRLLAKKLKITPALTTKGGNYKDRVGDVISAFIKIGIIEPVSSKKSGRAEEEGFRIQESVRPQIIAFLDLLQPSGGLLRNLKPLSLDTLFRSRFDEKVKYVIKSGSNRRQKFRIGKIIKSLLNPKLGISFESALKVMEEIEPKLKAGMNTLEIQSTLHESLKKFDEKAAENYRLTYPKTLSISMSDGERSLVNYKLVRALVNKEAKLKLTSNSFDSLASTVYNVITRNPQNYEHESNVREYIDALIHSEFVHLRSEKSFIREHMERAISALEGCENSLRSDEVGPARDLFGQFLEQICTVTVIQLGYLAYKNITDNVNLISNLLREDTLKQTLRKEHQLSEGDMAQLQRIKFMKQEKDTASKRTLAKMIEGGRRLVRLSDDLLQEPPLHVEPEQVTIEALQMDLPRQATTGVEELDNLLFGGIPENYAVILTAPSCDERDLLIERFLEEGAESGQTTFHITIDPSKVRNLAEEHSSEFYIFICNPEADAIFRSLPNVYRLKGVENLTEISIALNSAFRRLRTRNETKRACIEIVSDVLLQHHALLTRRWLATLIPTLNSRGFTVLAVMNPHMHASQETEAILDLFHGEINIYKKKTEKGMRKFLRIEKMFNQQYSTDELPLKTERLAKRSE